MSIVNKDDLKKMNQSNTILVDCRNIMDKFDESKQLVQADKISRAVHIPQMPFMFKFDGINEGRHPLPDQNVIDDLYHTLSKEGEYELLLFADDNSFFHTRLYYLFLLYGHDVYLFNDDLNIIKGQSEEFHDIDVELPIQFDSGDSIFKRDIHYSMEALERIINENILLIDVRSKDRYLGITEPIDCKKGHIPGAVNIPNSLIYTDGLLDLNALDHALEKFKEYDEVIVYCGSGMSATPMFTLLNHYGLNVKVYTGSFSEWITEDSNTVETSPNTIEGVHFNDK